VVEPAVEGRSLLIDTIRTIAVACRAWGAYPPEHPTVRQAIETAGVRVAAALAALGSLALGVARSHLRAGTWTLDTAQARTLAQALYVRQVAVLHIEPGLEDAELRALVAWLGGPAVPLEPGATVVGLPGMPEARHVRVQPLDYSAIRLVDRAETPPSGAISLADRLLNVLLEWAPDEGAWTGEGGGAEGGARGGPPPEVAMVAWLARFLEAEATGAQAAGPGGGGDGPGGGEPAAPREATIAAHDGAPETAGGPSATAGARAPGEATPRPETAATQAGAPASTAGPATPPPPGAPGGVVPADGEGSAAVDDEAGAGLATETAQTPGALAAGLGRPPLERLPDAIANRLADATAGHLAAVSGAGRVLAARQTAQLILRLPEGLRESLVRGALRVLAADPEAEAALLALSEPLGVHPVLRALRQLTAEGIALSRHAQRLVELLASTHSGPEEDGAPGPSLETLRAELLALFQQEDIDRYNPEDHLALLARATLAWPTRTPVSLGTLESLGERVASLADDALAGQLVETLLDLLGRAEDEGQAAPILRRLEDLVEGALARGQLDDAVALVEGLEALPPAGGATVRGAIRRTIEHLARVDLLTVLASALGAAGTGPAPGAVRLVRLLGAPAIRGLLQILADEPVRTRRRRVFDLLAALGPDVVPEATRWLGDPNWYVVRNVIALLRAVGDRTSLVAIVRLTGHADLRVRLEALRTLLELDPAAGHPRLLAILADPDPRVATAAAELAGQHGSATMVEPLLRVLAGWDLRGHRRSVRVAALHALGRIGRPEALPRLGRFFRDWWLPLVADAERRAAYESLDGYPPEARAPWVARGLRSRDSEVRALCSRLWSAGRAEST
jgi:hypothetical protein